MCDEQSASNYRLFHCSPSCSVVYVHLLVVWYVKLVLPNVFWCDNSRVYVAAADLTYLHVPVQLIEFLSDQNELAAADVLVFVREATQRFEQLRPVIIGKLLDTFPSIKSLK